MVVDYNDILKKTITTDFDLQTLAQAFGLRVWIGCRDDFHTGILQQYNYFIFNIQSRNAGNGSHWTAMYKKSINSPKIHCVYFDSYGANPVQEVISACRRLRYDLSYSNGIYQSFQSQNCGFFALLFLLQMSKGISFNTFRKLFSTDESKNDVIIKRILSKELIKLRKL